MLISDVNLHIHCGELTALIGTNGAGKTTLLKALLGQIEYKGAVRHLTGDGRPAAAVRTGYVPQQLEFDHSSPVSVLDFL
ncbi:MAG: ATP-binding cassette domain-containing protein, partial [Clostridia bacterium]|nr:ATP-binding cassette domain-containing protein [Clostridia bacterium]